MLDWLAFLALIGLYFAFASRRFVAGVRSLATGRRRSTLLPLVLVIPSLLVALPGTGADPIAFLDATARMLLYLLVPTVATRWRPAGAVSLHVLDIVAILALWFPVEFDWLPALDAQLAEGVNIPIPLLTGVVLAFILFLVLRPLPGIGYVFRFSRADVRHIFQALGAYTVAGIPLGLATRFLSFGVAPFDFGTWILGWPLGYVFTALPEELLFRGVIQNQIHDRVQREGSALFLAAVIFGLAHLNNSTPGYPEPNWMYALMATLAGLAYGWTWRRTGKITASAAVHASVNFVWGLLLGG